MSKKLDFREYECELIKVVDGDTIDCWIDLGFKVKWKARVRYMGLDTWESRTRDLEEKKKGLAAKERVKDLLTNVSSKPGFFRIKSHGVGKYGRVLGQLFIMDKDGKQWDINETLLTEGHAYVYDGGKKKVLGG